MSERRLEQIWPQLQAKKVHMPHFLSEIYVEGLRGIDGLRVSFDYPVSVVAGGNGSGKSTVLFAAACAYRVPGAGVRDFVPSALFPDYRAKAGDRQDDRDTVVMEFEYSTPRGGRSMRWRRSKSWNRSFFGRRNARQPERPVYLRTLANMSHFRVPPNEAVLTPLEIDFAQRMVPFRYAEVLHLSSEHKSLLFAVQEDGAKYSELHMSAGERAILGLAQEIVHLRDGLVLIDDVEAGLHPWVQQLLMLQLQNLALQNNLQVIVTSHSPVVLNAVPDTGRIFLERDEMGTVSVVPAYQDIVQNAIYGRAAHTLNVLCEDEAAEAILRGVLDHVAAREGINRESVKVGRATGASEFPGHARAFKKFGQVENLVFVLDGDRRDRDDEQKIRAAAGWDVPVFFLPGSAGPEAWTWDRLGKNAEHNAEEFGIGPNELLQRMRRLEAVFDSAAGRKAEIAKYKIEQLADLLDRTVADLCRTTVSIETRQQKSEIQPLITDLAEAIHRWRTEL